MKTLLPPVPVMALIWVFTAAVAFSLVSPAQVEADQVSLRWSLKEAEQFKITLTQRTTTITTVGKNAMRMQVEVGAELDWHVTAVDPSGNMQIEQTISRLTMNLSKSDGSEEIEYDSASAERPRGPARDVASAAGPLVGIQVQITLTPRGEVSAVHIPPAAREVIEKIQDRSKVAALLTPEGISDVLQQAMPLLPAAAVTVGDSWDRKSQKTLSSGRMLEQTITLTFNGADQVAEVQRITVTGQATLTPTADSTSKLKLKSQQLAGDIWYDSQKQRITHGEIRQELLTEAPYRDDEITTRLTTQLNFTVEPLPQK